MITFLFGERGERRTPLDLPRARSASSPARRSRSCSSSSSPATWPRSGRCWRAPARAIGPFRIPPLPYLLPMIAIFVIVMLIVVDQPRPRHRAPLLGDLPDDALRGDRPAQLRPARPPAVRRRLVRRLQPVRPRPDPGRQLDRPVRRPERTAATRPCRRSTPSGAAGSSARGSARGCRPSPGTCPIPALPTDFIFAAVAEELGLIGAFALLALVMVPRLPRPADRDAGPRRLQRACWRWA